MKKILMVVFAVCLTAGTVHAQKGYIRIGIGGGFGLPTYGVVNNYTSNYSAYSYTYTIEAKSLGLGNGFNGNVAVGINTSKYLGVELGFNEFFGLKTKFKNTSSSGSSSSTTENEIKGMMFQIIPAVTLSPGLEKINPYARIGVILGVLSSVTLKEDHTSSGGVLKSSHTENSKSKDYGGVAVGFTAAAGVNFMMNKTLDFYAELIFNGLHYSPSKGKYISWTEDGVDQLPSKTTSEKEWVYKKKVNSEDLNENEPDIVSKVSYPFTDVVFNVGIRIKFGKASE